jgi:hypothetical protein
MRSETYLQENNKMKKYVIALFVVLALMLSAFNGSYSAIVAADDTNPTPDASDTGAGPKDGQQREISDQERFILGVFSLEGTDLAVTADQAASLVTLWTSMEEYAQQPRQMPEGTPGTPEATPDATMAAVEPVDNSEEVDALFTQIQAVMTSDQLAAIKALELNQDSISTFMEERGIEMPEGMGAMQNGQMPADGTPDASMAVPAGTLAADGSGNGGPGGAEGDQGGGPNGGGRGGVQVASTNLIDALITLLEGKVNA